MDVTEGERFKASTGLVTAISVLLVADAIMAGVGASSGWLEVQLLQAVRDGYEIGEDKVFANDMRQGIIGLIQVSIYLPLAILFLRYLWRANHNARALTGAELAYSPGSCVWWFFIPIANYFKPFSAVKEIWEASSPEPEVQGDTPGTGLLHMWWVFWIISSIMGNVSFRMNFRAEEVGELLMLSWLTMAMDIVAVFLAVLALGVVRSIYRMQMYKAKQVFGAAGPDVPHEPHGGASSPLQQPQAPVHGST